MRGCRWRSGLSARGAKRSNLLLPLTEGEAVKVPYAKKWQKVTDKLAEIALGCKLAVACVAVAVDLRNVVSALEHFRE